MPDTSASKLKFGSLVDLGVLPTPPTSSAACTETPAPTCAPPMVMTRDELAKALKVSKNTISNWMARGMPCFYIGRLKTCAKGSKPRFIFADCLAWVQRGEF